MRLNRFHIIIIFLFIFSFIVQSCKQSKGEIKQTKVEKDSIVQWIKFSKDTSLTLEKRVFFLEKSYKLVKSKQEDTLTIRSLSNIAYRNLKLSDTFLFKKRNKEVLRLALKLKDSFAIGDIYWNYASYYNKIEMYDSAYYHFNMAEKYFKRYKYYAAQMQVGKSYIKNLFSDYSGSETSITKAIRIFEGLKKYKNLSYSYNSLALIQKELGEYDKALFYFDKSIEYSDKLKNKIKIDIHNNIGIVYQKKGEFDKAVFFFEKALSEDLIHKNPIKYARIIDNIAYTKLLNKDTIGVKTQFYNSLRIRDSLDNKDGILISDIHLATYYKLNKDTINAIIFAKEANFLAKEIKNSRDYLVSLKLLATLNKKYAKNYLEQYIQFNDSLQAIERKTRNKFTRIAYETDEYIEETKRLSLQKMWISTTSFGIVLILLLLYFLKNQKSKNEKLVLMNMQQKANEQLYVLTLNRQTKLKEEKIKERNRISEELHDGILGKLFGTRVGLGFLDIGENERLKEQYQAFLDELQTIEKEIRDISHKLNSNFDELNVSFRAIAKQLIKNKSKIGNFKYQIDFDDNINWQKINEIVKVNLYRIIQEVLQNIVKYAKAKKVSFKFSKKNERLIIYIKDDGIGFKIKKNKKGIGIRNIKSRLKRLKGKLTILSEINKGTTIIVEIPIKIRHNEK